MTYNAPHTPLPAPDEDVQPFPQTGRFGKALPKGLKIDGVDVMPAVRGEQGTFCNKRFWQWNRYTPLAVCNAAARDWEAGSPGNPKSHGGALLRPLAENTDV